MTLSRFLLPFTAALALPTSAAVPDEPTLVQRLERLAATLEDAREEAHVPGMSIAVVKDDEVVWARGFGLADLEAERAADENTIYAVGSTTKAFTAALVGMLVDEGRASWDDPVTEYLPYFDLQVRSDEPDAACTLRDLLSHRHGFSRMGLLWFSGEVPREEILRTAAGAEPFDGFRAGFHYCNVTYLAAGEAAGVAAESSWDELVVERIFEPLGMTATTISMPLALQDERLALGYSWNEVHERFDLERMADLRNIGPAGAINANVLDMAQWVRLQLGEGEVDGQRLISRDAVRETWSPQIEMGNGVAYGLGWMLHEHDGRDVVEHGGNIGGFSAQVAFVPEANVGYVLLMNRSASPLQQKSIPLVFDALLDEWPDAAPVEAAAVVTEEVDFDDYTGVYVANFATFRDAEFEVLVKDDHLAVDVPGQQTFDLRPSGEDGRWSFVLTDTIAVSFARDDAGVVTGLTMHQGGFDFEVPRAGIEREPEAAPETLEKYTGTYTRDEGGKRVKVLIVGDGLTFEDKGNWLPLRAPDDEGFAAVRARPDWGPKFALDAEGNVESLVFRGAAGDKRFTRESAAPDADLPTLEDVLALRGTDARIAVLAAAGGTKVTGEVWVPQAGVRGRVTLYLQGDGRFASHMDFGKFGRVDTVVRDGAAWTYDPMRGRDEVEGERLVQTLLEHPAAVYGDWRAHFGIVEVVRNDTLDGRPVHVVRLKKGDLPSRTYHVDAGNGDVLQVNQIVLEGPVRMPVTVRYSDFADVDGIRLPARVELENPASGRTVLTFETREAGLELGDEVFTLEE